MLGHLRSNLAPTYVLGFGVEGSGQDPFAQGGLRVFADLLRKVLYRQFNA